MSERVTVYGEIGRSATRSLLDEGIDQYNSMDWGVHRCRICPSRFTCALDFSVDPHRRNIAIVVDDIAVIFGFLHLVEKWRSPNRLNAAN